MNFLNGDPDKGKITTAVLIYIFNENGEILLLKRKKPPYVDYWESVGGHIKFGEKVEDAAKREVEEETGLSVNNLNSAGVYDHIQGDSFHRIMIAFATKTNKNSEIRPKEHDEFKWFKMSELPKNMIPGPFLEAHNLLFKVNK